MVTRLTSNAGQAMLELAVFGGIVLLALSFLMRVGMQANYEQEVRMAAFRRALAAAQSDNASVTGVDGGDALGTVFYDLSHRQLPNASDGYLALPRTRTEASAFVEWGDRLTFAYSHRQPCGTSQDPATGALKGANTQPLVVARADGGDGGEAERELRHEDFSSEDCVGGGQTIAIRGLVGSSADADKTQGETRVTNSSVAKLTQQAGRSALTRSSTATTTNTELNLLRKPRSLSSRLSGGGGSSSEW